MGARSKQSNEAEGESLQKLFGANIRSLRKQHGWSQEDLTKKSGMSPDTIGRLERGTVGASFQTIAAIAQAFEVPEYVLFGNGLQASIRGPRARTLNGIQVSLSKMTDAELEKAAKLLEVLT